MDYRASPDCLTIHLKSQQFYLKRADFIADIYL